jgi:hypothetical protein
MTLLPKVMLHSRANQVFSESGMDSPSGCVNYSWFKNYPYQIQYKFNSRGFRDDEWPDTTQLSSAIWCIGDSFTVGIGSPLSHTWVNLLQQQSDLRTINVSMDGASNDWIARQAVDILKNICPEKMVIQWTYHHRREIQDQSLTDERRRRHHTTHHLSESADVDNFVKNYQLVEQNKKNCRIIHSEIPNASVLDKSELVEFWNAIRGVDWPIDPPLTLIQYYNLPTLVQQELEKIPCSGYQNLEKYLIITAELQAAKSLYIDITDSADYIQFNQIDYARDGHHYDLATADDFVKKVMRLF